MIKIYLQTTLLFITLGCSRFVPQLGFDDVSKSIKTKTSQEIYWNQGTEADKLVSEKVSKLLKSPLTPDTATQVALLNNRKIQSVYENLNISQADLVDAGLLKNPIFNGEVTFPPDGVGFQLSIVQDFISIFQIPLKTKIAESQFEKTKLQVIGDVLELVAKTKMGFIEYQASMERLELAKKSMAALNASAKLAQKLYEAGNINDLALAQENAAFQELRLEVEILKQEIIKNRENLNNLMGISVEPNSWRIEKKLSKQSKIIFSKPELVEQYVQKQVLENNLYLAELKQDIVAYININKLNSDFSLFPAGEAGAISETDSSGSWGIGPTLSIPLPIFQQNQPAIFKTNAELKKRTEQYADAVVKLQAQTRSLLGRMKIEKERIKYFKNTLIPLKLRIFEETQKQYNGMLIGVAQLLAAKTQQIEAEQSYVQSLREYWLISCELEILINGKSLS